MREARKWTKITKVGGGGAHIYIPGEKMLMALANAEIDPSKELEVCYYATKDRKGRANIQVRIREVK